VEIKKGGKSKMKIYKGKRLEPAEGLPEVLVTVEDELGNKKHLIHQGYHSPIGFEWGHLGNRPADLARCILWDFTGNQPPNQVYQEFKRKFVAQWGNNWQITSTEIKKWIIDTYGKDYYIYLTEVADPRD